MKSNINFKPAVIGLDYFNQTAEIARFRDWVERISSRKPKDLLSIGIAKLLELDLLRYGLLREAPSASAGFGVVRQSAVIDDFIQNQIQMDPLATLLDILADGEISVDIRHFGGQPDFVFYSVEDEVPTTEADQEALIM
jgi:hypothetical protein